MKGVLFSAGYRKGLEYDEQQDRKDYSAMSSSKVKLNIDKSVNKFAPENTTQKMIVQYNQQQRRKKQYAWYKGKLQTREEAEKQWQQDHENLEKNIAKTIKKGMEEGKIKRMTQEQYEKVLIDQWQIYKGDLERLIKSENDPDIANHSVWWNDYILPYQQLKLIFIKENMSKQFQQYIQDLWDFEKEFFQNCRILHTEFQSHKQQKRNSTQQEQIDFLGQQLQKLERSNKVRRSYKDLERLTGQLSQSNVLSPSKKGSSSQMFLNAQSSTEILNTNLNQNSKQNINSTLLKNNNIYLYPQEDDNSGFLSASKRNNNNQNLDTSIGRQVSDTNPDIYDINNEIVLKYGSQNVDSVEPQKNSNKCQVPIVQEYKFMENLKTQEQQTQCNIF